MKIVDLILGRTLACAEGDEQKVGVLAGIPMLGLDGLSSAAYGPEAALTILLPLGLIGLKYALPITLVIVGLLSVLYFSYRQTIAAYPSGGGSYTVAHENLGERFGMLAAAALLLDYILNVAVGISAGVGALVSADPHLLRHRMVICLVILLLITVVNLRGVKEAGAIFMLPTYLFVGSLFYVLIIGAVRIATGDITPIVAPPAVPSASIAPVGLALLWLLMRAFASGCTAMTGVEAVSNGVSAFRKPAVANAQRTLTAIVVILAVLLGGIAFECHALGIGATDPDGQNYQSVLSMLTAFMLGRGTGYFIVIASVLAVLSLSANTSFAGFPRLCRLLALDDFMPHSFATRGRRLVYSTGIVILAVLSALLLILFRGVTDRLIPLFAIGAFLAFSLSQFGMVVHWRKKGGRRSGVSKGVNLLGGIFTTVALVVILVAKFAEGAWITILLIPVMLVIFISIRRHYEHVESVISLARPMEVGDLRPPLVVLPISHWSRVTERGLAFALRISDDVRAVHVAEDEEKDHLSTLWHEYVEEPVSRTGKPAPKLEILESPYRRLFAPLYYYILELRKQNPGRPIAVIIPELQEARWYQHLLHNQRSQMLKARLLLAGDRMVSVINVAWYLGQRELEPLEQDEHWVSSSS